MSRIDVVDAYPSEDRRMRSPSTWLPTLAMLALPALGTAQSVVVDEGTFAVTVRGEPVGEERFTIRRAGLGRNAIVIAHAVVELDDAEGSRELRPMLETVSNEGTASQYQLEVSGAESVEMALRLAGRRFVSLIRTEAGEEEREFLARPETRIVEVGVAHQYYFLRTRLEGSTTPIIEPRTRRQLDLVASAWTEEPLQLGDNSVEARRVTFSADGEERTVWFDRQGRVLRVEVPSTGYSAERTDLVG